MIAEEHDEVVEAFAWLQAGETEDQALAHLVHELADLLYVTYGSLLACGVDRDGVFRELHRANVYKITGPRREDGKQLKPSGWEPAELSRQRAKDAKDY